MATTWYCQNSSSNVNDANNWNDIHDGGGNVLTWASLDPTDVLCANGKTAILINVNVTCARISTTAEVGVPDAADGPGAAGGGFTFSGAAAATITADIKGGTTACLVCSHTGTGANKLTVVGTATGGGSANTHGINNTSTGEINITNVTGGSSTGSGLKNDSTGPITVTGTVTAGSAYGAHGLYNGSTAVCTLNNVTGASGGTNRVYGFYNIGGGATTVTGNIINTANECAVAGAITYNPTAGNYIQYPKTAGTNKFGLTIPAASILDGVTGDGQQNPVEGTYEGVDEHNVRNGITYGAGGAATGDCHVPVAADVRFGEDVDWNLTGTCYVPLAAEVLDGVDVDATVGTVVQALEADVKLGTEYGPGGTSLVGELATTGGGPLVGEGNLVL